MSPPIPDPVPANPPKILLIGWDSADWRIIDPLLKAGRLPHLASLIEKGARGNLASLESMLSPIVWTSIATGKLPHKHGILGFVEPVPLIDLPTFPAGIRPVGSTSRLTPALWNMLSEAGLRTHVIGWFASHPAEKINGICISERFALNRIDQPDPWPIPGGTISPADSAADFHHLRVHPTEITGDALLPFIPRAGELDQSDPVTAGLLTQLAVILAKAASMQAAATAILENEPWDFLAVYFQALDELGHHFMPWHPPALPGIPPHLVELYGGVMDMAYQFHDAMLGNLLALAGGDVTVVLVSDHGFQSGAQRPGPIANDHTTMAGWHRRYGILTLAGPAIAPGQTLHGSSVLDIAPTILHLFNLPVGADMDGKVLLTAFKNVRPIARKPSWDPAPDAHAAPAGTVASHAEEQAMLDQLVALGYLEAPDADTSEQRLTARRELDYNRIGSLLEAQDFSNAARLARDLAAEVPREMRYRLKLIQTLLHANLLAEAGTHLTSLENEYGPSPATNRLTAHLLLAEGHIADAMARFEEAVLTNPESADLMEQLGWVLIRLRRWPEAETRFRQALALDADRPYSHVGLARALVRQDQDSDSLAAALTAVGLLHFLPMGHFQLGAILSKMGDADSAIRAFEIGLVQQPGNPHALRYLSLLLRRRGYHQAGRDFAFPT
ncbi:MAG: type phosphodiesterase/nucleotide pyrophosphatase [Verrucomicrobiales bacterium]|nr:type phosphodiesterase/nucleotide pyrophosphatase [Verrucomicrobiales bacterium]